MKSHPPSLVEKEGRLAFRMLAPACAVVFALVVFPVLWNVWLSLKPVTLADLRGPSLLEFNLGFDNFRTVFGDPGFPTVLGATLIYAAGGSLLSVLLGLADALLVQPEFPGRRLIRGIFITPYIAPVVAVAFTWSFLLDPQLGVLNWLAVKAVFFQQPVPFFSQKWMPFEFLGKTWNLPLALASVVFLEGWRYFPFSFLFILARLQNIPADLYRAASVDGATPVQQFAHVTLPQLVPVLTLLFLFRFIWTINKFDDIFLLTGGQAGTRVMTIDVYEYAFGRFDIGAGSAAALVLFAVLGLFMIFYFRWLLKEEES